MTDPLSRRDFLHVTAAAGALVSLAPPGGVAAQAGRAIPAPPFEPVRPGWFDTPMRWAQLTLVENDPGQFDAQFWLDYFRRIKADAACLSAGGIVAYYPTNVPLHHRSDALGTSDPFGTLVKGCRALGMRVIARTDPHAAREEVRAAHPDWIAAGRRRPANPPLGERRPVGHLRARTLQLRVHGPGPSRDRHHLQGRRRLHQPVGAAGRVPLHPLPAELQGRDRSRTAARPRPIRRAASSWRGGRPG